MENKNVPSIRFKGFIDDWEQRKLGEVIINELKGKAKANMDGLKSIYLDAGYLNGGKVCYVDSPTDVSIDDVLILWDGSQAGAVYHGFEGALGSTLKAFKPKYSGDFLYQFLIRNQEKIYNSYRTPNIPHVIKSFTSEFKITNPKEEEQTQIGNFFKQLDESIALQESELELLKLTKKSFLQQLFPDIQQISPNIRFENFQGEWEQRKLGELMSFSNGINAPKENYGKGRHMISVLDILSPFPIKYNDIKGSVQVDKNIEDKNKVENGDLVFVRSSEIVEEVGWAKAYLDADYALYSGFTIRGKKEEKFDSYFFELALNYSNRKQVERKAGGSTRYNVSQSILNSIELLVPDNLEQTKIGNFFKQLNETITLQERKLSKLKETKKSFLHKMFI